MKRTRFISHMMGLGVLTAIGCRPESKTKKEEPSQNESDDRLQSELIAAWDRSERMTMANVNQMPAEHFGYKYTEEAMTFSEQWRHCVIYTCGQLAGRIGIENPYDQVKLPVQMPKEDVIKELEQMYRFVKKTIAGLSNEALTASCEFAGETIPVWRLFYAMENHIIHHRGQCVVYLRSMGVVPKGYYGW